VENTCTLFCTEEKVTKTLIFEACYSKRGKDYGKEVDNAEEKVLSNKRT
jgi:hypothetical protein